MRLIAKAYLVFIALSFAVVGTAALVAPQAVADRLDLLPQSVKGTAEVRSLYDGGFVSWSLIIIGALRYRSVAQGIGTRSISELVVDLKGEATRFVSMVGLDDAVKAGVGTVTFEPRHGVVLVKIGRPLPAKRNISD